MLDLLPTTHELAWPAVIAIAWLAGEMAQRWNLPRITAYAVVGFGFGPVLAGAGANGAEAVRPLLANIAFGLILFEFGYRVNLRWFRLNPWLAATGVLESSLTFAAVYLSARALGTAAVSALLLASLSMATSPASLTRVVNDLRSAGQVTERALHLAALNCVLAVFTFKVILGFWTFDTSGDIFKAVSGSGVVLLVSAAIGSAFGAAIPVVLRLSGRLGSDATLAFAIAVLLLVALAHALNYSPMIAALACGLVARHRRVTLNQAQRNFGTLGDLLVVFLFVHVAAMLEWQRVADGMAVGMAMVAARAGAKTLGITMLARASGTTWGKGALTAAAMMPFSTFVVLVLEDTRHLGIALIDTLAPLAAATLILLLVGPVSTQLALRAAGEVQDAEHSEPRS